MRGAKQKEMFEISDLRREGGGGGGSNTYFWGYEDFVDIFGVITKLDYTMHFRVFSEGQGTKWRIFFGLLKFQIFIWGA